MPAHHVHNRLLQGLGVVGHAVALGLVGLLGDIDNGRIGRESLAGLEVEGGAYRRRLGTTGQLVRQQKQEDTAAAGKDGLHVGWCTSEEVGVRKGERHDPKESHMR